MILKKEKNNPKNINKDDRDVNKDFNTKAPTFDTTNQPTNTSFGTPTHAPQFISTEENKNPTTNTNQEQQPTQQETQQPNIPTFNDKQTQPTHKINHNNYQ